MMGEDDEEVFARMLPRKANRWVWAVIAGEFVTQVLHAMETAATDATTVLSQRFNYHDERNSFLSDIGRDLESLDDGFELAQVTTELDEDDWDDDEED
jgi:hypothetical protein